MAGQLCDGLSLKTANLKNSKAYCEGYGARAAAVTPTNPHASGSEAYTAFAAGVTAKADESTPDADKGCCAPSGGFAVAVPDLSGMDEATADAAIVAADLVVGTVTGTGNGGTVTVQSPAAAAVAQSGDTVDYTLVV
jgi:hypothetical protein